MYDELVKKANTIDSNKILKRLKMLIKRYLTPVNLFEEFSTLTVININARMTEASKNYTTKNQAKTALDLGDKNREKIKITSDV